MADTKLSENVFKNYCLSCNLYSISSHQFGCPFNSDCHHSSYSSKMFSNSCSIYIDNYRDVQSQTTNNIDIFNVQNSVHMFNPRKTGTVPIYSYRSAINLHTTQRFDTSGCTTQVGKHYSLNDEMYQKCCSQSFNHQVKSSCHSDINMNMNNNVLTNDTLSASVVNLSSLTLTQDMHSLLSKGLNFCPTPGEPDTNVLRHDLDKFHVSLKRTLFFEKFPIINPMDTSITNDSQNQLSDHEDLFDNSQFRNPSSWCPKAPINLESLISFNESLLTNYIPRAPSNHNLTKGEKLALAELSHNNQIVIKPADKGSAVVVMNREDYIREGMRQLNDNKFYIETPEDLTNKHNDEIIKLVNQLLDDQEISKKCSDYLVRTQPRTSQLYLLPKIHKNKNPVPGRPIVSANNSPTERISEFVDYFLKPLVKTTKSFVKDTTDFINKIEALPPLSENAILCTVDVTSLYTNIPNNEGILACAKQLRQTRLVQVLGW